MSVPSTERWLPIPGFDGYEVSDLGRVVSKRRPEPRILAPRTLPTGYLKAALSQDGGKVSDVTVHRLVMLAFVGPCPEGQEVRHLDGSRTNNALDNLAYGTKSENIQDTLRHGTHFNAGKTRCSNGHEFTPDNVWIGDHGQRRCKTCHRAQSRAYQAQKRAAAANIAA